mmetsp:Transcript_28634/g.80649  ORF Transcript_28634/g.80649 Transcript_28634/m.80649 type:complete len:301 (-) Transcript_28634:163-1065(-)
MEVPSYSSERIHSSLLAHVLSFLDLDSLASCALCCREWSSTIHKDDTAWRLMAHHIWPPEVVRVTSSSENTRSGSGASEEEGPYSSYRELVLDRNARFTVPCMPFDDVQLRHASRSLASPRGRHTYCDLLELVWNKPDGEVRLVFNVQGESGKVRMPVTTFFFKRILDDLGNKYDDINVSPPCTTEFVGDKGSYCGTVVWKAEEIFEANQALEARCQASHLIAKVPAERVSEVRLSLCFGLPCRGPVAVVGAMMDQAYTCRELDLVLSARSQQDLDAAFKTRFHDGISFRPRFSASRPLD